MEEFELLVDLHKDGQRQGPGSVEDTLKALSMLNIEVSKPIKLADIGCGSGAQTITLAQHMEGEIVAVDLFPAFLDKLNTDALKLGLQHKISTLEIPMEELSFADNEFDVIWSEGAIYVIGFEEGIKQWKRYLKTGGYMVVSEITWLTNERPFEIEEHWNNEYPQIATAASKFRILEENGYSVVGYFALPESSWMDNYYKLLESRFDAFLKRHKNSELAVNIVEAEKDEIRKYKQYKEFLSYGFYIARKL